jgi:hypothetical protein
MTITISVIISRSCAVASFVPWVAAARCSSSWRSLHWSGRVDVFKRGIGAVVRWMSSFLSYCIVAPYFVCFLVSAIGMLWPINLAVRRCIVDSHTIPEFIMSISSPTNHSVHSATPPAVPLSLATPILRPQIFNIVHIVCGIFPHLFAPHSCFVPFLNQFQPCCLLLIVVFCLSLFSIPIHGTNRAGNLKIFLN